MGDRGENHMEKVMEKVTEKKSQEKVTDKTLSILRLKDYTIHIDIFWMVAVQNSHLNDVFLSPMKIVFIIANSTDPGDMLPHLDLHSLYLFIGIQN